MVLLQENLSGAKGSAFHSTDWFLPEMDRSSPIAFCIKQTTPTIDNLHHTLFATIEPLVIWWFYKLHVEFTLSEILCNQIKCAKCFLDAAGVSIFMNISTVQGSALLSSVTPVFLNFLIGQTTCAQANSWFLETMHDKLQMELTYSISFVVAHGDTLMRITLLI